MKLQAERGARAIMRRLRDDRLLAANNPHPPQTFPYRGARSIVATFVRDESYEEATTRMGASQYTDDGHDRWMALREEMEALIYEWTDGYADATFEGRQR